MEKLEGLIARRSALGQEVHVPLPKCVPHGYRKEFDMHCCCEGTRRRGRVWQKLILCPPSPAFPQADMWQLTLPKGETGKLPAPEVVALVARRSPTRKKATPAAKGGEIKTNQSHLCSKIESKLSTYQRSST